MNLKQACEDWIPPKKVLQTELRPGDIGLPSPMTTDGYNRAIDDLRQTLPSLLAKIEQLLPPEKELVVKDKIREYLGNHQYGDMVEINILNPKMTKEEQEQARGYNQALKDVRDALLNTKEPKG